MVIFVHKIFLVREKAVSTDVVDCSAFPEITVCDLLATVVADHFFSQLPDSLLFGTYTTYSVPQLSQSNSETTPSLSFHPYSSAV